jgi:hypothetical protein
MLMGVLLLHMQLTSAAAVDGVEFEPIPSTAATTPGDTRIRIRKDYITSHCTQT